MKNMNITHLADLETLAFSGGGEDFRFHTEDSCFVSGSYKLIIVSSVVIILSKKSSPSKRYRCKKLLDVETLFILFSFVRILGVRLAQTLFILSLFFKTTSMVVLQTTNQSARSLILTLPSLSIASLTDSTKPELITPGRSDLLSASVEVLPAENRLCHL